ncbi:conserved hypothetical protein [Histoplasma capsulatum H143]|uniref:Uncharacterized protein n=1 Tax=Ajellomyces capsulatus (strain H143) TaxID=544712 RepID=C6H3Y2_AJECH|nr:conserved hypothetical protein [Histoplasma capsulatum H143]
MWISHRTLSTLVASLLIQCLRFVLLVDATCLAQYDSIPDFVLKYAPLIYLHSEDQYMPSAFATLLENSKPTVNYTPVADVPSPLTLDNLDSLNSLGGKMSSLPRTRVSEHFRRWFSGTRPDRLERP